MPPSTRLFLAPYPTPGLVTWLHRSANCSALGRLGAGGGSSGNGALTTTGSGWDQAGCAMQVRPADAAVIAATVAAPVARNFTVMDVPSRWLSTSVPLCRSGARRWLILCG